jgi:hypothetical protein
MDTSDVFGVSHWSKLARRDRNIASIALRQRALQVAQNFAAHGQAHFSPHGDENISCNNIGQFSPFHQM